MQPNWNKGRVEMQSKNSVPAYGHFTSTSKICKIGPGEVKNITESDAKVLTGKSSIIGRNRNGNIADIRDKQTSPVDLNSHGSAMQQWDSYFNWVEEDLLLQKEHAQLVNNSAENSKFLSTCDYISDDPEPSCISSSDAVKRTVPVVTDRNNCTAGSLSRSVDTTATLPRAPVQAFPKNRTICRIRLDKQNESNNIPSTIDVQANNHNVVSKIDGGNQGKTVTSGRSLHEIERAINYTKNNSKQKQRYEMRGGHSVEICSRVDFPDRLARDVSVTVEASHSNGCHRVVMLKGLTAKKRLDLGPKVKDCRLRMDQIVFTRPNTSTEKWQKSITMSYDSDFRVGLGGEKSKAL